MSFSGDPYRMLGLTPGATLDEVKRAYRRLAKLYHPDSAGAAATARFIAVQGAYEMLMTSARRASAGMAGGATARPGAGSRSRPAPGSRPGAGGGPAPGGWPGRGSPAGSGGRPWPGSRAGSGGGSGPGGRGGSSAPGSSGGPGPGGPGSGDRTRPGGPGATGRSGAGSSASSAHGEAPRRERTRRGERSVPRARPGSTSYDGADPEAPEPSWHGATWYGESSGTYWRVNPREYADPRKHGPEYQARARRVAADMVTDAPAAPASDAGRATSRASDGPVGATQGGLAGSGSAGRDAASAGGHPADPDRHRVHGWRSWLRLPFRRRVR